VNRPGRDAILAVAAASLVVRALASPAPLRESEPAEAAAAFSFVDVAREAGVTRVVLAGRAGKDHLLDSAGSGAAWLDYDRDGRLDLYVVNGWRLEGDRVVERGRNALYRQTPDRRFEDVTDRAGVGGEGRWGAGAFVADYDRDGWPDLFVTCFGPNLLYRNLGDGRFEEVAARVGLESPGWNTGAAFFDADGDGDLDVYLAAYIQATVDDVLTAQRTLSWRGLEKVAFGPFGLEGAPDRFFRNDAGRFVDTTAQAGMPDKALAFGFAVRAADFDADGDVDVFVANDSDPNYLYRNEGGGRFREVAAFTGAAFGGEGSAQASMGVAVGDVNGDAVLDVLVTNFSEDFSTLYAGLGGGIFEDVSKATGVGPASYRPLSWGTAFADFDNDGDLDLVIANGHIYPQIDRHPDLIGTYAQRNLLLENRGPAAPQLFVEVSGAAGPGFEQALSSRGLAVADYDDDGDLDLLVTHLDAPPSLLRNEGGGGAWLTVVCEDEHGSVSPVGTEVRLKAGGRGQWRDVASGDSYLSTHDPRLHFGLGSAETVDEVDVRWPDGTHTVRRDVPARQMLRVRKGS